MLAAASCPAGSTCANFTAVEMPVPGRGYKDSWDGSRGRKPSGARVEKLGTLLRARRRLAPGREDRAHEVFRHGGVGAIVGSRGPLEAKGRLVACQVIAARVAAREVMVELRALLDRQLAVEVGHQEVEDLFAGH